MDYFGKWNYKFVCPKCGREAQVYEAHACQVSNAVIHFDINGYEEDEHGNFVGSEDVDCEWGKTEIGSYSCDYEEYFCGKCDSPIDGVRSRDELFNWLLERGMVCRGKDSE